MVVTPLSVLRRRLAVQRLSSRALRAPENVVDLLTCVQSQEYAHGLWSLGMRSTGTTHASVQAAFDSGRILRTHILRPTWHFVSPADIRWILRATSPRVLQTCGTVFRSTGLDEATLRRTDDLLLGMLSCGRHLTRPEMGRRLTEAGVPCSGSKLAYVVMNAELRGLICSGPMRGAAHTYAVLDERAPLADAVEPDEPATELAVRFFTGHGPAALKDLTRWSSMTVASVRAALEAAGDRLDSAEVDGERLWFAPDSPPGRATSKAWLLPLFDELMLTYPRLRFPLAPGHPHPPDGELYVGCVVLGEVNVGTWRRTVSGSTVAVEVDLAPALPAAAPAAVDAGVERLVSFLGLTRT